ncbi:MAG: peptidoglycan-binding domain-containing protein [Christensenellales bacterium]|jgi:hypothetical protein
MFCSSCGKTIRSDWSRCRHCNAPVGESRFDGVPYTSTQVRIVPGQSAYRDVLEARPYTKTTYTGDADYDSAGDLDARTTYRPVYEGASVPEEIRSDLRAAVGSEDDRPREDAPEAPARPVNIDAESLERNIEGFDLSQIKSRPIVARRPAGLSSDVREYVKRLETGEERAPRRGKHLAADDPYAAPEDAGDAPEEEYVADEPQGIDTPRIVRIVVALVAVAALFVAGIYIAPKIIGNFRSEATAPIEGVTRALYDDGVALLRSRVEDAYISDALAVHQAGGFEALTARLDGDTAAFAALMPAEEPRMNDELFVSALTAIQSDINNAITHDAVEIATEGAVTSEDAAARWTTIRETVEGFSSISSAAGLAAVVSGERIADYIAPTPEPQTEPAPKYAKLAKGDEGEDVQKMQERLWELGYLDDDRDGKFGTKTQTAVKLFQQGSNLETSGIADSETLEHLYSDDAPLTQNARITPVPEPTPEPTPDPTPEATPETAGD